MNIQKIRLADIDVGDRLREVDEAHAELMAASLREIGQQTPIQVRKSGGPRKYRLMAGAHRVRAAELAEWDAVDGVVRDVTNHEADLIEIDENLMRAELTVLDRSVFMARRKELYEAIHPKTRHGGDRRPEQVAAVCDLVPERFTKDTAERLGVSERAVQSCVRRAAIGKETRRRLTGTLLSNKAVELDALLELSSDEAQLKAVNAVLDGGEGAPRNIREAVDRLSGRQVDVLSEGEKLFDSFKKVWSRADVPLKRKMMDFAKLEMKRLRAALAKEEAAS